jgi:molybdopterin-binding protein
MRSLWARPVESGTVYINWRGFSHSMTRSESRSKPRPAPPPAGSQALLTPRQAAEKLGISYPALKHWILAGRIRTVKTPGGHHRVPLSALDAFLGPERAGSGSGARISGRNQLLGTVVEVSIEGLLAKVVLTVGSQRVTAIITADAARELALKTGDQAVALIKATEVMIVRP